VCIYNNYNNNNNKLHAIVRSKKKTNERKRKTNWEILKFLFSAFVAIVNSGYADICEMSQLIYFCVLLIN